MAHDELPPDLQPSLLDRLIDPASAGVDLRYSFNQLLEVVRRDLEDLLNTRRPPESLFADFDEVQTSIMNFGLPDFVSLDRLTNTDREKCCEKLAAAISAFEPRLRDVRVTLAEPSRQQPATLRFRVNAKLYVDPSPDVAFETLLELTKGRHLVQLSNA